VDLDPRLPEVIPSASSSCGSTALLASLDATAAQFAEVDEAVYGLDGDRVAFYHWLQRPAPGDDPPPDEQPDDPSSPTPLPPSRAVPEDLVGAEWTTLPTTERVVALTFDGGANADGAASILDTLATTGTPATFFLTGRFTVAYPAFSASIAAHHPVGNHTMNHPDLTDLTDDEVREEVLTAHAGIVAVAARSPRPWFRFPYGARDQHVIDLVNDLDYGAVRWTTDTLGWQGTSGGQTVDTVVDRVLADLQPGQVVLMHLA
jgi:peptidoglycan/xylan/chitin deacetylase (PgdA/CDA1 family)